MKTKLISTLLFMFLYSISMYSQDYYWNKGEKVFLKKSDYQNYYLFFDTNKMVENLKINTKKVFNKGLHWALGKFEESGKIFFATDFHIIINTPVDVDVFVNNKLIGTLTEPIYKSQLVSLEQYDTEILYPFLIIYEVDEPQNVKYTYKPKSKSTGIYLNGIESTGELYIDKAGNYDLSIIYYEGE